MRVRVTEIIDGQGEYGAEAVCTFRERLRGAKQFTDRSVKLRMSEKAEAAILAPGEYDVVFDCGVLTQTLPTKEGGTWTKDSPIINGILDARKVA